MFLTQVEKKNEKEKREDLFFPSHRETPLLIYLNTNVKYSLIITKRVEKLKTEFA